MSIGKKLINFITPSTKTGIDPVIAAAHRRRNGDFPIKRKFILNKTPNLIKD